MATRQQFITKLHDYGAYNSGNTDTTTYNSRYPGFNEANYKNLEKKADSLGLTGYEKEQFMDNLYVQVLPQVQNQIKNSERRKYINDANYEVSQISNPEDKLMAKGKLTVTELSQQLKEKFNIDPLANDEEVFNSWIRSIPDGGQLLANYMNNGDRELLYAGGLETKVEAPAPKESSVGGIQSIINKQSETESDSTLGKINNSLDNVNLIGKVTQGIDNLVQKIPTLTYDKQVENLANKMNNLTEDEIADLYQKYTAMIDNGTDEKWNNDNRSGWELFWDAITGDKDALDRINTLQVYDYSEAMPQDRIEQRQIGTKIIGDKDLTINEDDNLLDKVSKKSQEYSKNLLNFVGGSWGGLENYAEALGVGLQKMKDIKQNRTFVPQDLKNNKEAFEGFVADKVANFGEYMTDAPDTLMGRPVDPNVVKFFTNMPQSFIKTLSSQIRGKTNPLDSKVGLLKMLFTEEGQQAMIDRYGSIENIANTMNTDPVGLADDMLDWADKLNAVVSGVSGGKVPRENIGSVVDALSNETVNGINNGLTKVSNWARDNGFNRTSNLINLERDVSMNPSKIKEDTEAIAKQGVEDVVDASKATAQFVSNIPENMKNLKDNAVEGIAERVSGNKTAQDKLFQAQEPTLNRLSKERNTKNIRNKADVANELVVKDIKENGGELPIDTQSRVDAHERAMKNKWNEIENKLGERGKVVIDTAQLADDLDKYIDSIEKLKISKNKSDLDALREQSKDLRAMGQVDLLTLEKQKEMINANLNDWDDKSIGNVYKNGMTELTRQMGQIEDDVIARIPGEFQDLKNDFGALADGYGDVIKANVKAQRAKYSDSISNYSRIKGIGDILKGVYHLDLGEIGKGTAQMIGGEVTAKLKDKDWLIEQGFKDLAAEMDKPNYKSAKNNLAGRPTNEADISSKQQKANDNTVRDLLKAGQKKK